MKNWTHSIEMKLWHRVLAALGMLGLSTKPQEGCTTGKLDAMPMHMLDVDT